MEDVIDQSDDLTIMDDHGLLRRVPENPKCVVYDESLGRFRPSSANFINRMELSVSNERGILESGKAIDYLLISSVPTNHTFALARFTGEVARKQDQIIYKNPTLDDEHHATVFGSKPKKVASAIAKQCSWAIEPKEM